MNIEDLSGSDYYSYRQKTSAELHRKERQAPASEFEELKLPTLSSQMKCFLTMSTTKSNRHIIKSTH